MAAVLAGLLLASAILGVADAAVALWSNRAVAPHATVPLCLTAPFVLAFVLLLPAVPIVAFALRGRTKSIREVTALLLGLVAAVAVLRAGDALRVGWTGAGATSLAAVLLPLLLAAAAGAALLCRRVALAAFRVLDERMVLRLVLVAAIVQATAFAGIVWQLRREGRGVVRDALGALRGVSLDAEASVPTFDGASRDAASSAPENLVLVTIDTLRADQLESGRMPQTAAFAASATRFDEAYAASSWTLPSVASLMTGLPASRHDAGRPRGEDPLARSPLSARHATLATRLARAGFATRAIVTNPYLGLGYGLGQGFAAYENVTLESEAFLTLRPTLGFWLLEQLLPSLAIVDRGAAVTRRAARFLTARAPGTRFFLWLHYVDPHAPYAGTTRSFRDDLLAGGSGTGALPRMAQLRSGELRPTRAGRTALRTAYARAVRAVDDEVGAILTLLEQRGLAVNTLVVVTADHGEEFWDHGGVEHGHTLFSELVHVPLLVRCPGCAPRGARIDAAVGLDGLAPTLLDLLGVGREAREGVQPMAAGFASLLRGEPYEMRPVLSENLLFAEERVALRTQRYTYVVWANGKEELYDRRSDPRELRDLAARRGLLRHHRELLAGVRGRPFGEGSASADGDADAIPRGTNVTPVTRRALQALGYIE